MSAALYVYGFVPASSEAPPSAVTGVDEGAVRVIDVGPVGAAVSEVDAGRYQASDIEAKLKDLAWVARQGAAHETVVTWCSDHTTIVPARLFTIFSSEEALRTELAPRLDSLARQLERFTDTREWDLKVHYDAAILGEHLSELSEEAARAEAEIQAAAPGRRYLLERKREGIVKREAAGAARGLAADALARLGEVAEEVTELQAPTGGDDLPVVLNAAMLVSMARAEELLERAAELVPALEKRGIHAKLTGPWAPYRFVQGAADD
jgi:hypothetical protein